MTEEDFANLAATWLEEKIIELGADKRCRIFWRTYSRSWRRQNSTCRILEQNSENM